MGSFWIVPVLHSASDVWHYIADSALLFFHGNAFNQHMYVNNTNGAYGCSVTTVVTRTHRYITLYSHYLP